MTISSQSGYFGGFGGAYVPESLHAALAELTNAYRHAKEDSEFWTEFQYHCRTFSGRPTPLTLACNLTRHFGGAKIYVKREDLNHTGSHKLNNVLGQALLARRLGKQRLIAETGAGQHGVATATIAARFGLKCSIYMGATDVDRQRPNVFWMEKLGAKVVPVTSGQKTLKDAVNEALKEWAANTKDSHYVLGTACGPHPYPEMVAHLQSIIGDEAKEQILAEEGTLPVRVYACVGGGSNALGVFQAFLHDRQVGLVAVEAAGAGLETGLHAARLSGDDAQIGVLQGYKSLFLQNSDGQTKSTHSIAAGLDYVGVSPILAHLKTTGRLSTHAVTDDEVLEAHKLTMELEGLIPALESTHAFSQAFKDVSALRPSDSILINQSGRGDKDIFTIADAYRDGPWLEYIRNKSQVVR